MADGLFFSYVAVDAAGKRVRGAVQARDDANAFERLRAEGLSPLVLKPRARPAKARPQKVQSLAPREAAELLSSLADLLKAGADIRTALTILGDSFERPQAKQVCRKLSDSISGGDALDRAFASCFGGKLDFVASMVAAGEAASNLPGGLHRAAEIIESRLKIRDQLVSVLAYPTFVLISAIAAVFVILLFIVPSIAPLVEDSGAEPPMAMGMMIGASHFVETNITLIAVGAATLLAALVLAGLFGLLRPITERILLDGPARRTVRGITFGAFAISLGSMLEAGASMSDALRLAIRSVSSDRARGRLEHVPQIVRQGRNLSQVLADVSGFPRSIVRLASVGEESNTLGEMLMRGGRMEESTALRRIEAAGRIAGPALIIVLGLLLGVLMGGLLSGVSQMGSAVLE